jgi:CRP-like cAMP-binding protein
MEKLRHYLSTLMQLPDEKDWRILLSCFSFRMLKKNDYLVRQGQVCDVVCYIEQGLMRTQTQKNGSEFTIDFFWAGMFCSESDSYINQAPCLMSIQAVQDSMVWCIQVSALREMYAMYPTFQNASRLVAEQFLIDVSRRMTSLIIDSAEERYLKLINEKKMLIEEIPLNILASYLGISTVYLSRIRKRLATRRT